MAMRKAVVFLALGLASCSAQQGGTCQSEVQRLCEPGGTRGAVEACLLEHLDELAAGCKDFFAPRARVMTACADERAGLVEGKDEFAHYRALGGALSDECARAVAADPRFARGGAPPPMNKRLGGAPPPMQAQREVSKRAPAASPPKFAEKMGKPPLPAKGAVSDRKGNFGRSISEHMRAKADKAANAPGVPRARAVPEGAVNPKSSAARKAMPPAPKGGAPPATAEARRAALVDRVAKKVPQAGARAAPGKLDKPFAVKDARASGPTEKPSAERREASRAAPSDFGKMKLRGMAEAKPSKA